MADSGKGGLLWMVLGLAVGFAVGWFVHSAVSEDGDGFRGGSSGSTPSSVAAGVPQGVWSKIDCGGGMEGVEILDEIQMLGVEALQAGQLDVAMFMPINDLLLKCAVNEAPFSAGDDAVHAQMVLTARASAQAGDWNSVLQNLMGHGH